MADELIQNVIETIDTANRHRLELEQLVCQLGEARAQVESSSKLSCQALKEHFTSLKVCVHQALDRRLRELTDEVQEIEKAALEPLHKCELVIQANIEVAANLMDEGKALLMGGVEDESAAPKLLQFKTKNAKLDINSLPEVPCLQEVSCIHVDLPRDGADMERQLVEAIQEYGSVLPRAPLQITDGQERAGAVLVKWTEAEDQEEEFGEFRVRYCAGDNRLQGLKDRAAFTEAYRGTSTHCLVRRLAVGQKYSLQVQGRVIGQDQEYWSAWSIPWVAMTTLAPYEWDPKAEGYQLSDSNSCVTRSAAGDGGGDVVYSRARSFNCGHSLVFTVLAARSSNRMDGICLAVSNDAQDLCRKGALFVTVEGLVYVDGQEKATRLPELKQGSTLTFDTELLSSNKVRATVEVEEKILTFDWCLDSPDGAGNTPQSPGVLGMGFPRPETCSTLFFAARFAASGWSLRVD